MEHLVTEKVLHHKDEQFKGHFAELFSPDVPNIKDLSMDALMNIRLKDEIKPMVAHAYSCSKKYCKG